MEKYEKLIKTKHPYKIWSSIRNNNVVYLTYVLKDGKKKTIQRNSKTALLDYLMTLYDFSDVKKTKKIFFWDFENIPNLDHIEKSQPGDSFYIFYSKNSNKLAINTVEKLLEMKQNNSFKFFNIDNPGEPQSLDVQLITEFMMVYNELTKDPFCNYEMYIISKDKGYDHCINHIEKYHKTNNVIAKRVAYLSKNQIKEKILEKEISETSFSGEIIPTNLNDENNIKTTKTKEQKNKKIIQSPELEKQFGKNNMEKYGNQVINLIIKYSQKNMKDIVIKSKIQNMLGKKNADLYRKVCCSYDYIKNEILI